MNMGGMNVNRIREYRRKMGMTQVELAKKLRIGQGTLSGYETGRFEPDMNTMRRLAEIFGASLDTLFGSCENAATECDNDEQDLWELREQVRRDPERHYLFSLARNADIGDVRQAVAIIDALRKTRKD